MHGSRSHADDDAPMAEMNMIPLIDIALTLVIILMVTTVFIRNPGVSLRLPETVTREGAPETQKDVIVAVTRTGAVFVDGPLWTCAPARFAWSIASRRVRERIPVKNRWTPLSDRTTPARSWRGGLRSASIR